MDNARKEPTAGRGCQAWALLAAACVLTASAHSQTRPRHEYVRPALFAQFDPLVRTRIERDAAGKPTAVRRDGARLEAPQTDAKDVPELGPKGILRPSEARPDLNTQADRALNYHMVFNPTVAPLRRNVVFDQLEADYRLVVAPGPRRPLPISPAVATPGREVFWAQMRVGAKNGEPVPIPSVSPDMRVLGVWAEPEVAVEFEKDGADNFYARVDGTASVRLKLLVDAGSRYFYAPVSGDVKLGVLAGRPGTELNAATRAAGLEVLDKLGVSADAPFDAGLGKIVAWFRAFEAGPPPKGVSDDVYTALALGKVGVCRHRAFAFLVTARAAGVPTRFVQNEAHAFVEIRAPDGDWRRIDLGGEAPSVSITGDIKNRRLHRPPPDPFPKPKSFLEQYSNALTGDGEAQVLNAPPPMGPAGRPSGGGGVGDRRVEVPYPRLKARPGEAPVKGQTVRITLGVAGEREVFRGEPAFEVEGQVMADADGQPIPGLRLQIYAVPLSGGVPISVGAAVTSGAEGRFSAPLQLPATVALGRYTLAVVSKANDTWAAGRSNTN